MSSSRAKRPFRTQFATHFGLTLLFSIVCTLLVWGGSLYVLFQDRPLLQPANYYEQFIPEIVEFAQLHAQEVSQPTFQQRLESIIPLEGIDYQVLAPDGGDVYGSQALWPAGGEEDVLHKVNTQEMIDGRIVSYYPVITADGSLSAVLVLSYRLSLVASNPRQIGGTVLFVIMNMAVPFIFIVLFTLWFARRIGKRFEPPIQQLIASAERIQRNDLDFTLANLGGSTELEQLARAFDNMRQALRTSLTAQWESERQRRDIVASLAHDLQTPLTIIGGHVDNLLETKEKRNERLDDYLQTIRRQTDRAVALVNDMQGLADIERPEFILTFVPTNVRSYFTEQAAEYEQVCRERGIQFTHRLRIRSEEDHWLSIDPRRVDQIIANVMDNSLRLTPKGGTIAWHTEISGTRIRMHIHDTGPGFSADDMQRLFEPFYQGDAARSQRSGRMGLGLYIVKTLAEKHGGTVEATNVPEGGASIRIELVGRQVTDHHYENA